MVPEIIHCCWFGGPKTRLAEECLASWRKYAPGWTIREWDEAGIVGLAGEMRIPGLEFFRAAVGAKKWAMASDWARMAVLFAQGGVYLDLDSEFVAPIDRLPAGEWVAGEWTANGGVWMNPGGGIALEAGSPVAKAMLDAYGKSPFDPMRKMMPWINERLAGLNLRVLDPEVMSPIGMDGKCRATGRTVAVHRYAMSWASPKQRILQWLSWHGMRGVVDWALKVRKSWRGG